MPGLRKHTLGPERMTAEVGPSTPPPIADPLAILAPLLGKTVDELRVEVDRHITSDDVMDRAYRKSVGEPGTERRNVIEVARRMVLGSIVNTLTPDQRNVYHAAFLHMRQQARVGTERTTPLPPGLRISPVSWWRSKKADVP